MLKNLLFTLIGLIVYSCLTSCQADDPIAEPTSEIKQISEPGFITYTILKNEHYTSNNIGSVKSDKLKFMVVFDSSAIYTTLDKSNQADINKLYGFSDCGSLHQANSARFGWRWYHNQLELFAYTYRNQIRYEKFIKAVDLNKAFTCEIEAQADKYVFRVDDTIVEMERGCAGYYDRYKLFPYFGGDEVAPHDINILIKEII